MKIKNRAAILLLAIISLLMIANTAAADPFTGEQGTTQSMVIIGCALAMGIAGIGSALGLMLAGTSAVAVTGEKPELFGRCLVFQVLPMTQAVYGLLTALSPLVGEWLFRIFDFIASGPKGFSVAIASSWKEEYFEGPYGDLRRSILRSMNGKPNEEDLSLAVIEAAEKAGITKRYIETLGIANS